MDSIDSAYVWAALSLPPLAMTLLYLRSRYNELIALHLVIFWLQMFAYGSIWLWSNGSVPLSIMLVLALELTVYGAILIACTPWVRSVSEAALEIPQRSMLFWIALSGGLSIYIVGQYGNLSLITDAGVAESAGLPSYLTYANSMLMVPAWGAVFCCVIQRRFRAVHLVAVLYVMMEMGIGAIAAKRAILMLVVMFVLFRPLRLSFRFIVIAGLVFLTWGYYEGIRNNVRNVLLSERSYDSTAELLETLATPPEQRRDMVDMIMEKNLQSRIAPIWLLAEITQSPERGEFVVQAILNVVPSALGKTATVHENETLTNTMGFPFNDQPWTLLSELQAEFSAFAALLTPLLYVGLFLLYGGIIARWRGSPMVVLVALGVVIQEAGEVQTTLTAALIYLRTMGLFLAIGVVLWHLHHAFKLLPQIRVLALVQASGSK